MLVLRGNKTGLSPLKLSNFIPLSAPFSATLTETLRNFRDLLLNRSVGPNTFNSMLIVSFETVFHSVLATVQGLVLKAESPRK